MYHYETIKEYLLPHRFRSAGEIYTKMLSQNHTADLLTHLATGNLTHETYEHILTGKDRLEETLEHLAEQGIIRIQYGKPSTSWFDLHARSENRTVPTYARFEEAKLPIPPPQSQPALYA